MDIMLKAPTRDVMDLQLLDLGLLVQDGDDLHPVTGVSITGYGGAIMPTIYTAEPTYVDGEMTDAGVASTEYHCNVRDNRANGIKDPTPYHEDDNPTGTDWGDVTWIDPTTVNSPAHGWG